MSSKTTSLVREVQRYWNTKIPLGKSMKKVAEWGDKHPASAVPDMLHRWNGLIAKSGIGKAQSFEIGFEERPAPAEKHCKLGNCLICGTAIRYGTRVSVLVNGRKLNFGEVGDLVGEECFDHMTYIAEAASQKSFKMYEADTRQREKGYDKLAKVTVSLGDLAQKAVKKLQKKGFDLDSKILAEVADDLQKKIMKGDVSGVEYETDKGKTKDMIGWALANKEKIYDANVRYTVALLAQRPDLVKPDQWAAFIMYQWQERPLKAAGELGGVKEDILYLAQLREHPVVQKYGKVDLEKVVEPVKAFNKARWEEIKLGKLLERDAVTKAQSRAAKAAVPYLRERREFHNRETINSYCTPEEFNAVLGTLKEKYEIEKKKFSAAKAAGIEEPDMPWKKDTWKALRDFFELEERVQRTDNTASTRDVFLNYVFMQNADSTARTIYVEGKKTLLARQKGDEVLSRAYSTIRETKIDAEKLDKLLNGAIEFDSPTHYTKRLISSTGMLPRTIQKIVQEIRETRDSGLIPTKYVQPDGDSSMLERALNITANYKKDDGTVAEKLTYLRQLEDELGVQFTNIRAEDGLTSRRKADAKFKTKNYSGKTYFSAEQIKTINNVFGMLNVELKELDIPATKSAVERVEQFHKDNNVYTMGNRWYSGRMELEKDRLPDNYGWGIKYKQFSEYVRLDKEISALKEGKSSAYFKATKELKDKINAVKHDSELKLPENLDAILSDGKTILRKESVDIVNKKYDEMVKRVIQHGYERLQDPKMKYFDIIVERKTGSDEEDHNIKRAFGRKHNPPKGLLKLTKEDKTFNQLTIQPHPEWGTWYGRGRTREYIGQLCSKADQQKEVYINIIGARK